MASRLITAKKGTETSSFGTNGRINHDSTKFYNSKLYSNIKVEAAKENSENQFPLELCPLLFPEYHSFEFQNY